MARPKSTTEYCKRGHLRTAYNLRPNGACRQCHKFTNAAWSKRHPYVVQRARKKWLVKHPGYLRESHLIRTYQITTDEFDRMVKEQDNKCKICDAAMNPPHVDHDHVTKQVRSLLCSPCNLGLGQFREDVDLLLRAAMYLQESEQCPP